MNDTQPPENRRGDPPFEPHYDADEISLRDLYLILRRGLPLVLAVAVLAGVLAFAVSSLLPPVYEAESTTLVTPPPVRIQGSGDLSFAPHVDVSFESYETLAQSRPVLEATVAQLPRAGVDAGALGDMGSLEMLLGPQRPDQVTPLSVTHRVRSQDPELAAALADAWAATTLETVRSSLLGTLNPVAEATAAELERLETRLREAETAWAGFLEGDTSGLLRARLAKLQELISDAEQGLVSQGEIRYLEGATPESPAQAQDQSSRRPAQDEEAREPGSLSFSTRVDLDQEIAATQAALTSLRGSGADTAELARLEARLAGLQARRDLLAEELEGYRADHQQTLAALAALELERGRLERELVNARDAHESVAGLQPTIDYLTGLAPTNARILSEASVPAGPVGPRRLLNTALAVVLAGMLALLFVFLREAVAARDDERSSPARAAYAGPPSNQPTATKG